MSVMLHGSNVKVKLSPWSGTKMITLLVDKYGFTMITFKKLINWSIGYGTDGIISYNKKGEKMTILKINKKDHCESKPEIQELIYGTFVTDVPSGRDCIYIKVKKKGGNAENGCYSSGTRALSLNWQNGFCVLLNITYGSLRQIPGDTKVTPLKPCLTVAPLPVHRYNDVKR